MTCPSCNGTGARGEAIDYGIHMITGCPDCEGTGRVPDPCPACGQQGHAMAPESGPGPPCAPLRDVTGDFEGATYYDCEDSEQLSYTDPDEAIGYALDGMDADPDTLTVTAYKRAVLDLGAIAENVLELALERLDEALGDPGGYVDSGTPTPAMREAARVFAAAIAADYTPWQCEPCGSATVDVATWRKVEGMPREEP